MSSNAPGLTKGMLETSLTDLVSEMGYGFTASVEECRSNLNKLVEKDINPSTVARALALMCRTHGGLEESRNTQTSSSFKKDGRNTWNVEVFVQALKEAVPNLQWSNVMDELDHTEFVIKDRQGLIMLIRALRVGLQNVGFYSKAFPIDYLYGRWKNVKGQLSLIQSILKNPDVFCFADYPFLSVPIDTLKTLPEQNNKDLANWRNLNLVELLLDIAECGFYPQIQEIFKVALQNCPDVLILTLMQIPGPVTMLRQELLTNLIPIFLDNHPNSAIILHHAWHLQTLNFKHIIVHAMAEWYVRGDCDQTRLSRILDVAQDLKALSMLLNAQSYPFIIDLACLASKREYLKLEKWLTDKISKHGEPFVIACLKFLHRRCPQLIGKGDDAAVLKTTLLPKETLTTLILCLQSCAENMSTECKNAIITISTNCSILFKTHPPPSATLRSHRDTKDDSFNPSVMAGQLLNPAGVDSITGINSNLASMNLGGPAHVRTNHQSTTTKI